MRKPEERKRGRPAGAGRKALPPGVARHHRVTVMVRDADLAALEQHALAEGLSVGSVAYNLLFRALARERGRR